MDAWVHLFQEEFDLFRLGFGDSILYFIIAWLCWFLMRFFGPKVILSGYVGSVEQYKSDNNGLQNVIYRIVMPVVISYLFLLLVKLASLLSFPAWIPSIRWMPIFLYWIIRLAEKTTLKDRITPVWTSMVQAAISLMFAIYFDWSVICALPANGLNAFDQSNVGFQIVTAAFFGACSIVLMGITGGVNRYNSKLQRRYRSIFYESYSTPEIDEKTEAKLFSYIRRFENDIPNSIKSDPLLYSLFLMIMLIEDTSRPSWFRWFERRLFKTGLVKSTGIMQVRSPELLSDEESVRKSAEIVEGIWTDFLKSIYSDNGDQASPDFFFSEGWYGYNYRGMLRKVSNSASILYGKYRGSFTLPASNAYCGVAAFCRNKASIYSCDEIYVLSHLFSSEAKLFDGRAVYCSGNTISLLPGTAPAHSSRFLISNDQLPTRSDVESICKKLLAELKKTDLLSIEQVPGVYCRLQVGSELDLLNETVLRGEDIERWTIISLPETNPAPGETKAAP